LVPVPPISNKTTAIPAVILTVNLFLFIYDIEFARRYINGVKSVKMAKYD